MSVEIETTAPPAGGVLLEPTEPVDPVEIAPSGKTLSGIFAEQPPRGPAVSRTWTFVASGGCEPPGPPGSVRSAVRTVGDGTANGNGDIIGNGVVYPNANVKLTGITDGTSNTMIVGEVGNWYKDDTGTLRDLRPSRRFSWMMGTSQNTVKTQRARRHPRFHPDRADSTLTPESVRPRRL